MSEMQGKLLLGRYQLETVIGTGGMAYVYRAKDIHSEGYVAVKVLKQEYNNDKEFVRRFQREAFAAQNMLHPNIIKVIDVGEEQGLKFIVMELIEGETLKDKIRRDGALSVARTIDYGIQVARAIEHAHRCHIVHRDIKSQNIIVDKRGVVKVADFGIARATNAATVTSKDEGVLGSVHYFSPEQAKGETADELSDIYSLGVVLYEMATGRLPFDSPQLVSIALMHINDDPTPLCEVNPQMPPALEQVVKKAMSKTPENRYRSAIAMEVDLSMVLAHPEGGYVNLIPEKQPEPDPLTVPDEQGEEVKKAPKERRKLTQKETLSIAAVILGIVLITSAVFGVQELSRARLNRQLVVYAGQSVDSAAAAIEAEGYATTLEGVFSDVPRGTVVEARVDKSEKNTVLLQVSQGPETSTVETYTGKTLEAAQQRLYDQGFVLEDVVYSYQEGYEEGLVYGQSIDPDTVCNNGTPITLYVCRDDRPATVEVPKVTGSDLEAACHAIEAQGLVVGEVLTRPLSDVQENTVVFQSVDPGLMVETGTVVDLTIAQVPVAPYFADTQITFYVAESGSQVRITLVQDEVETELVSYGVAQSGSQSYELHIESQSGSDGRVIVYVDGSQSAVEEISFTETEVR